MSLGGGADTTVIDNNQREKKKVMSAGLLQTVSNKSHSCILPELACDVTKNRITAKVIWASLILRLTFHLIWVSMTASQRRPRQVDSLFNLEKLIRLATTSGQDNTKSQKSQRKRKKGEGGCIVMSQAAIRVC